MIAATLRRARENESRCVSSPGKRSSWRGFLATLPGVGAAVLPVGACPACWPAYAGVLSALGLSFLLKPVYLLPLIGVLLGFALFSLVFRARQRRGYGPLFLGLTAATAVLAGKFISGFAPGFYVGIVLLIVASVWNAWPRRRGASTTRTRPSCAQAGLVGSEEKARSKEM